MTTDNLQLVQVSNFSNKFVFRLSFSLCRCHWDLDKDSPKATSPANQQALDELARESELPWCGPGDLTFVAEQVSHHPPVSAFYAEHIKKKVSVNAHIYTKSSFLGMSVRESRIVLKSKNVFISNQLFYSNCTVCFRWQCTTSEKAWSTCWNMTRSTKPRFPVDTAGVS